MIEAIGRISSPYSESWLYVVLVVLAAMLLLSVLFQPEILTISFSTLFSTKERDSIFSSNSPDLRASVFTILFVVGTMAVTFPLMLYQNGPFSFSLYGWSLLFSAALLLVQYAASRLIAWTFFSKSMLPAVSQHVIRILIAFSVTLFLLLLLCLAFPILQNYLIFICLGCLLFYTGIFFFKLLTLFSVKTLACFYIFLYLCTLEILPLLWIVFELKKIVQ